MLAAHRLSRAYGSQVVLRDLDLQLSPQMRVGVIGANGSGKTTLLRLLAGEDEPNAGTVTRAGGVTVGYARQDVTGVRGQRVLDAVVAAAAEVVDAERTMRALEEQLADGAGADDGALLRRYGQAADQFDSAEGYAVEARARKVLAGLGFSDGEMLGEVAALSGGWMMRVALGRLLLRRPDVLLLDEPTNHLDFAAGDWLADYLAAYDRAGVGLGREVQGIGPAGSGLRRVTGSRGDCALPPARPFRDPEAQAPHDQRRAAQVEVARLVRDLAARFPITHLLVHHEVMAFKNPAYYVERDRQYANSKGDPGAKFMTKVRALVEDLRLSGPSS